MPDMVVHVERLGIAAHLGLGLIDGGSHLGLRSLALQVFQFDDIGVLHIREYLVSRTEEDIGIPVLVVEFRDGAVVAALARQGERVAMHEGLPFWWSRCEAKV